MIGKSELVYEAIVAGVKAGLRKRRLYDHVIDSYEFAQPKHIMRAAYRALIDPRISDKAEIDAIYDLALSCRTLYFNWRKPE